ncbi:MAG: PAS domain-containing protein [Sulfuricurvum sp.]|uniref:PAS domain-containing protein n=1 Tax=Sulfuricurvum sp. TaxID=2025608 RepID=UPI00262A8E40|nr:PAS domain-containing protein [Sulfuricurvum sp.]MDD2368934.1 PAS domain-containing protein [Sulfuricurvum sp.]MDD2950943.1 PAS domain-containing protein [Sulfuricurvum sp.]MDD5118660.1 PAS domain-containing protein [Sulfuricurvum sp.]
MEKTEHALTLKEAKFEFNELFFSITDQDSTIRSGNDVFVRISGYTKEELLGSFHNIIRHPDMPKVIFKTLWDYLLDDKPIVAYVKNKTKQGGYYWVLAAVFPLEDRYISIRIKPNTKLLAAAKELYPKLLKAESVRGMDDSSRILPELLQALGYENYDRFMNDALLQELNWRQNNVSPAVIHDDYEILRPSLKKLKSVYGYSCELMSQYDAWFEKIDLFTQVKSTFEEKGQKLRELARDIVFLSLNASVSSYKVESGGETFGVLASDIRSNAKENEALISRIDEIVQHFSDALNTVIFAVAGMRLQIEMVTYFIQEVSTKNSAIQIPELIANISDLVALVAQYADKSKHIQAKLDQEIQDALKNLNQLEQQMMYLGYIQIYGIIEAAGSHDESVRFGVIFSQLKSLVQETTAEIEVMQKIGGDFSAENRNMIEKSHEIDLRLRNLTEEISAIMQYEE